LSVDSKSAGSTYWNCLVDLFWRKRTAKKATANENMPSTPKSGKAHACMGLAATFPLGSLCMTLASLALYNLAGAAGATGAQGFTVVGAGVVVTVAAGVVVLVAPGVVVMVEHGSFAVVVTVAGGVVVTVVPGVVVMVEQGSFAVVVTVAAGVVVTVVPGVVVMVEQGSFAVVVTVAAGVVVTEVPGVVVMVEQGNFGVVVTVLTTSQHLTELHLSLANMPFAFPHKMAPAFGVVLLGQAKLAHELGAFVGGAHGSTGVVIADAPATNRVIETNILLPAMAMRWSIAGKR